MVREVTIKQNRYKHIYRRIRCPTTWQKVHTIRGLSWLCQSQTSAIQVQRQVKWASGLVVMTSRLQRGDRLFNSGLAH